MKIELYEIAHEINSLKDEDVKYALNLHRRANLDFNFLPYADEQVVLSLINYDNLTPLVKVFILGTFSKVQLLSNLMCDRMISELSLNYLERNSWVFIDFMRERLAQEFRKAY